MKRRLLDLLAMLIVGDALLTLANPKRHSVIWEVGPKPLRETMAFFADHPVFSRWLGVVQALFGIALAERQRPAFWGARHRL